MVKKLQKDPSLLKLGGDTRTMTYLFSDIRGFTPISEQFKTDPQGLGTLINRYMTPMTDLVMQKEGTIDKYIGDALMAIWNAPLDVDNHAQLAIETAQEMEVELKKLNKELKEDGLMELGVGIGINTGDAVVGNMGSNQRFDYSVLGDAVNLAARLEGQSKGYGVKTIIGEDTAKEIDDMFAVLELDKIAVKGKTVGLDIYTVLQKSYPTDDRALHNQMHILYKGQMFKDAIKMCKKLKGKFDGHMDDYYEMWIGRCEYMSTQNLPKNWNGVFIATTK